MSSDVSISPAQIQHRGGGFAIALLSSSLRWCHGGGFCSGSVLVWIVDREFGFLWVCWIFVVLVCVSGSGFVLGWTILLMGLWVLLVVNGFGFVGFVDVIALLVVDGFVGFTGGQWLVVTGFLWVLLGQVSGFVGSVFQFVLLL